MVTLWKCLGVLLTLILPASAQQSPPVQATDHQKRGSEILKEIVSREWAREWKGATLGEVKLVKQKPDLAQPTRLPPAWSAKIKGPGERTGHLIWDHTGQGRLVEFSLDGPLVVTGDAGATLSGIPPLQQFPIKGPGSRLVASGCVPTAAASVVSFWISNGYPQWRGADGQTDADLARRLRSRMKMTLFPDKDGFTANGMALAGAFPGDLATALREDAAAHQVAIECDLERFSMIALQREIKAMRPALVSCLVRVPHQPELSWGHEVAAVGWTRIDGVGLVGVLDNFFPTKHPGTIRWIRQDAMSSIISLRPQEKE